MQQARRAARSAVRLMIASCALLACGHSTPPQYQPPGDVGPYRPELPRRLTFSLGDDRTPSVSGDVILYSRQSDAEPSIYTGLGREECIAYLPREGGTIQRELCPDRLIPEPDTLVDTWFEPVLSPDGSRLAYTWQRGLRISPLAYLEAWLMVTPADRPTDPPFFKGLVSYLEPGPDLRRAGVATHTTWVDANRLRFLATFEHVIKVKGGGAERVSDTIWKPLALMEADLSAGTMRVVPGGDSAIAYAGAPGGGIWLVRSTDSSALLLLDPATGAASPVGRFSAAVRDLVNVDGSPVAIVQDGFSVELLDVASGTTLPVAGGFPGPVVRLAPAGGRRFVAQAEQDGRQFGAPEDLWLVALP